MTSWFLFSFPSCELVALWFLRTFEYMVSARSWKDRFLFLQDFYIVFGGRLVFGAELLIWIFVSMVLFFIVRVRRRIW